MNCTWTFILHWGERESHLTFRGLIISASHGNVYTKVVSVDSGVYLCLFAKKDIPKIEDRAAVWLWGKGEKFIKGNLASK